MHITVTDPDNLLGSPAYDGPADLAWQRLRSGTYSGTTDTGEAATLLVIRSATTATGSSAVYVHRSTTEV